MGRAGPRWVGRCPACGSWNSLVEEVLERTGPARASGPVSPPVPITEVAAQTGAHRPTRVEELDRVLGGGLVPGSVVLLAGEPGIGKSTLLLGVLAGLAADGPVLYVCAEESREQVRLRAERLDALHPGLLLAAETDLGAVRSLVQQVRLAKERAIATFLVGQVTKEGAVAGPKTLEHLVDVVLNFEGDQHHALRLVRCTKNRFGPAYEVGCFEMTEAGLEPLVDPSRLFLSARSAGVPGVACTVSLEGRRPLVTEVQALVVPTGVAVPRRTAQGLDAARLAILVAVLDRRARIGLAGNDVFAATAGGVRITEPAADLAVCLALASAARDRQVPPDLIAFGEIGLGGEIRPVPQLPRRLAEAARLGFRRALVPATGLPDRAGAGVEIELDPVGSVAESLSVLATAPPGAPRPPRLGVVPR